MKLTLRQLRAFVTVYGSDSLTRAAKRLHLTQAAVSILIRQMEEAVDAPLFVRTTRSLRPTALADEILVYAQRILGDLENISSTARDFSNRQSNRLIFGASAAVAAALMPQALQDFAQRHPQLQVTMHDMAPEELVRAVLQDIVEFSIGTPNRNTQDVELETLLSDFLCVICNRDSPLARKPLLTWRDIEGYPTISSTPLSGVRTLIDDTLTAAGRRFEPTYSVTYLSTALSMTAQGLGISILPSYLVGFLQYPGLVARQLHEPSVKRELYIVRRKDRPLSPTAKQFLASLKKTMADKRP